MAPFPFFAASGCGHRPRLRDTLADPRVLTGPAGRKLLELIGIKSALYLLPPK